MDKRIAQPHSLQKTKRWLTSCLLFFAIACTHKPGKIHGLTQQQLADHYARVDSVKPLVRSGDLIFRNGTDEVSRAARSMNRIDTSFSHCGLVFIENDSVIVYHAIGGSFNPDQKLRRDPIDSFLIPEEASNFAIYRYQLSPAQTGILSNVVKSYYAAGLKFDMYFNFLSDKEMYCSEFVFKSLNKALSDSLTQLIEAREWPFGISPDDLFLNERSRLIKRVDFAR